MRFRREARTLALLNHPNIAAIYGLEESDEQVCLVLELVEGEILRAPLPIENVLTIACQVASAFPRFSAGRPLHYRFRGLLSVYSHYGLHARQVAYATLYTLTGGSSGFVSSTTAPIATGPSAPVPGWDLHPLLTNAFSRRVFVLTSDGLAKIMADFNQVSRVTVENIQAWTWTTPPLDGASTPATFFATPVGRSYLLVANDLHSFARTFNALNAIQNDGTVSTPPSSYDAYRSYDYWAHRQIRRTGHATSDALGLNDSGADVLAISFFVNTAKREGFVQIQTPARDRASVAGVLPQSKQDLIKPQRAGFWQATIPLLEDESSSETIFYVLFHLGFGAVL